LDLGNIEAYGVQTFGVAASSKYLARLKNGIDHLKNFPELARPHPNLKANARTLPIGVHIIIYRFSDEYIDVIRIVHHRQNWKDDE
jgi:toxin ParE1/3/4